MQEAQLNALSALTHEQASVNDSDRSLLLRLLSGMRNSKCPLSRSPLANPSVALSTRHFAEYQYDGATEASSARNRCKSHVRITLTSWLHRSACLDAIHSFGRMRCMWPSSGNDRLRLERQCRRQRRQLQLELLRLCVFPHILMCLKAPPWLLRWLHPQHEQTRRSFRKHATS